MYIITIIRIIVGFQGWDEGTLEGLGSSVRHSRSGEQEQYTSIPDGIGRDNESPIVDTRRPYHDEVQSVTAMERFSRKRIAVYALHPLVLGVPNHQTIEKIKMPLALCWSLQFQCFQESINLQNNTYKMYNAYNGKPIKKYIQDVFLQWGYSHPRDSNTGQQTQWLVCWPLGQGEWSEMENKWYIVRLICLRG